MLAGRRFLSCLRAGVRAVARVSNVYDDTANALSFFWKNPIRVNTLFSLVKGSPHIASTDMTNPAVGYGLKQGHDYFKSECRSSDRRKRGPILTPPDTTVRIIVSWHTCLASSPRRLARPRTSPFHGGNTGSNPVGDANLINHLQIPSRILYVR